MTAEPTRAEGLARLKHFVHKAGRPYAARRNYDLPDRGHPHVSRLSPYIRHRLVTEAEVVEAVLARHSAEAAQKFLQEVFWRSYWKGWLEMRPSVWGSYRAALDAALAGLDSDSAARLAEAEAGRTGIAAFDAWARELAETGYLHNHARMWCASIWIFTLRLPWEIGADFFLRHLLDGDPASNTLSWRWVAGLQTRGKHYLARPANIAKYTEGRHVPAGVLNTSADPLSGPDHPARRPLREDGAPDPGLATVFLLTEEDLSPGFALDRCPPPIGHAALLSDTRRSPRPVADHVRAFSEGAARDTIARWGPRMGAAGPISRDAGEIAAFIRASGARQVVTPYAPTGPAASTLRELRNSLSKEDIFLIELRRGWDTAAWPHATHGFFRFKEKIPDLIAQLTARAA